MGLQQEEG